ncbi:GFA family protein [Rhodobacteraceae bacterium CCMM004]|nr:GFA family protein [Rhodobacteraceae bacterium CCMM004]
MAATSNTHDASRQGRCLCGAVRYSFDPETTVFRAHCHCESCRRATSSPVTTFFGVRDSGWRWTGAAPASHASSPGVRRMFCGTCGSPMAYATDDLPGQTHFYAATLADPAGFAPERHDFWGERLAWLPLADDLPKHD